MPRRPIRIHRLPESLVDSQQTFQTCIDHLESQSMIAFDTEFVGEHTYRPELCLVQVATAEQLFVIDPYAVGTMEPFWRLLTDSKREVIVHAGREEIRMCRAGIGVTPAKLIDLQPAAGMVGLVYPISYASLALTVLGHKISKSETLTDWRKRPLTPAQLQYAFDDVRFLIPAWKRIAATLTKHDRHEWAAEEFVTVIRKSTKDDDPETEKWRKIKGLGSLRSKNLAVARELSQWRDRVADRQNRPVRTVMRDEWIIEIAKRLPRRLDDLNAIRGIPRNETSAILDAIARALSLPPDDWPEEESREIDTPNQAVLTQLLHVVLSDWAIQNRVNPSLIATQSELKEFVRCSQKHQELPDDNALSSGWRLRHVQPVLMEMLKGSIAVRVNDINAMNPLGVVKLT